MKNKMQKRIPNKKLKNMNLEKKDKLEGIVLEEIKGFPNMWETVGNNLRIQRERRGYRTDDIAEILGITSKTVENHETANGGVIAYETLRKYCAIYGCDMGYLLGEYKEPTKDLNYICSQIGLTVEAVETLKYVSDLKADRVKFENLDSYSLEYLKALCDAFFDIINVIIESKSVDDFWSRSGYRTREDVSTKSGKENVFPIFAITDYIAKVRKANEPISDAKLQELETEAAFYLKRFKNMGGFELYTYVFDKWKIPYDRIDIGKAILDFFESNFAEMGRR